MHSLLQQSLCKRGHFLVSAFMEVLTWNVFKDVLKISNWCFSVLEFHYLLSVLFLWHLSDLQVIVNFLVCLFY